MSSRQLKCIIERGASWTLEETKLLLGLWGQDLIQRQSTNAKRSKEVYEKISEKFEQNGFDRTPDQVRTRVFNMIAEYRRILKDPNPERMKKCIFYEPLDRIYHAKHMDEIKAILDDYEPEPENTYSNSPAISDKDISDCETTTDGNETVNNNNTTTNNTTATTNTTTVTKSSNATAQLGTGGSGSGSGGGSASASGSDGGGGTNVNNNDTLTSSSGNRTGNEINEKSCNVKQEDKELPASSQAPGTPTSAAKRIKLDSPKSGQNQANQTTSLPATTTGNSTTPQDNATTPSTSSKQTKSQATSVPLVSIATTIGGTPISSSSTIRTQSLLMPHATASSIPSTSTPITKFTTSANNNNTPSSYININPTKQAFIRTNQIIGPNGNESNNLNGTATRFPTTAAITSHQLYQAPVNTFDVTSSALLIDRMFAHLSRESENMREWIALEKERLAIEKARRQQETEREFRRERVLMDTLMKFQDQWLSFLSRLDPRIVESLGETPSELKIPSRQEAVTTETPQHLAQATATYSNLSNNNNNSTSKQTEADK